jgi:Domain of unknown function (DUF4271)
MYISSIFVQMIKWKFFLFAIQWSFVLMAQDSVNSLNDVPKPKLKKSQADSIVKKPAKKNIVDTFNRRMIALDISKAMDTTIIKDSLLQLAKIDSLRIDSLKSDSLQKAKVAAANKKDTSTFASIFPVPFLPSGLQPFYKIDKYYIVANKDPLFYFIVGLFFLIGFIRVVFSKYINNIFTVFFQTSYRQKQLRDQLLQSKLASLLLNVFFVLVFSAYMCLLIGKNNWLHLNFWWLLLYTSAIVSVVYTIKYLFLQFTGWIFNTPNATELYTFVVFLGNKIVAILLLPIVVVLAYDEGNFANTALIISYFLLGIALAYRFVISLGIIRTDLNVSGLHFFLYLCTVEVLPLLLMYKAAINYIGLS